MCSAALGSEGLILKSLQPNRDFLIRGAYWGNVGLLHQRQYCSDKNDKNQTTINFYSVPIAHENQTVSAC